VISLASNHGHHCLISAAIAFEGRLGFENARHTKTVDAAESLATFTNGVAIRA
jgi:hypothetical protein